MEQQTEVAPVDEKRQRQLANLAKARATRAANIKARSSLASGRVAAGPAQVDLSQGAVNWVDPPKRKSRRKTVKMRREVLEPKKPAKKNSLPDTWLDGIHHAPNGCPVACNATACIITGENVCGHPDTNLQAKYLRGDFPDVVERFNAARMEIRRLDAEKSLKK